MNEVAPSRASPGRSPAKAALAEHGEHAREDELLCLRPLGKTEDECDDEHGDEKREEAEVFHHVHKAAEEVDETAGGAFNARFGGTRRHEEKPGEGGYRPRNVCPACAPLFIKARQQYEHDGKHKRGGGHRLLKRAADEGKDDEREFCRRAVKHIPLPEETEVREEE